MLELPNEDEEEDGAATDADAQRKGKSAVIKTSTRQVKSNHTCNQKYRGFIKGSIDNILASSWFSGYPEA